MRSSLSMLIGRAMPFLGSLACLVLSISIALSVADADPISPDVKANDPVADLIQQLRPGELKDQPKAWRIDPTEVVRGIRGHSGPFFCLAFSPDGKSLCVGGSEDHSVVIWNLNKHDAPFQMTKGQLFVLNAAYSPDGMILATGHGVRGSGGTKNESARLWSTGTGKLQKELEGHRNGVYSLSFSSNGKLLATVGGDEIIKIWETATAKELFRLSIGNVQEDQIISVSFSPDGKKILAVSQTGQLGCWHLEMKEHRLPLPYTARVLSAWFSKDGENLTVVDRSGVPPEKPSDGAWIDTVRQFSVRTWKEIGSFRFPPGYDIRYIARSQNDMILATVGFDDTFVDIWDLSRRKRLCHLGGHRGGVQSLALSPDNGLLAVAVTAVNSIILWDLTQTCLESLWLELAVASDTDASEIASILIATPHETTSFLKKRLNRLASLESRVVRLALCLDDDVFEVRERTAQDVENIGTEAAFALEQILHKDPPLEVHSRVKAILIKWEEHRNKVPFGGEKLTKGELGALARGESAPSKGRESLSAVQQRALQRTFVLLEQIGNRDCRALLDHLSKGESKGLITALARRSLERMKQ